MHICIVGTGASGLLVANTLKEKDFVTKVTIIGSPKIPHIGVGESTTLTFQKTQKKFNVDLAEFIKEAHAAIKYGVYYKGWSEHDWIHFFKSNNPFLRANSSARRYSNYLANKDPKTFIHDIFGHTIWQEVVGKNNVFPDPKDLEEYPRTFHFDAGQYINFLTKIAKKCPKVEFIEDTVVHSNFTHEGYISNLILENNQVITADYYVNTTGQGLNIKNIFNEEYTSLEDVLLTTKAVVYPLEYTNKREQFHPYTVAKTMKNGWRWITPTWQRIGTGYVFSENHISIDEAVNEFLIDIGDKSLVPTIVDFKPRYNKKTFKSNHCSIGMANGFLEPLDAPGLAMTGTTLEFLEVLLERNQNLFKSNYLLELLFSENYKQEVEYCNTQISKSYEFWTTFILNQYKLCHRIDTQFWLDHKNVKWKEWDKVWSDFNGYHDVYKNDFDMMMLSQTTASRNLNWASPTSEFPFKLDEPIPNLIQHHLDWVKSFYKL
jgi:tryptophan 7-halogenase